MDHAECRDAANPSDKGRHYWLVRPKRHDVAAIGLLEALDNRAAGSQPRIRIVAAASKRHEPRGALFFWILVILCIGLLAAMALPMLLGRVYTADDLGAFHLPIRAFYAQCLAAGNRFDWSPQMYCGFYLTGEGQLGGYHPLHLLLYQFLPLSTAFDVECLISYPLMLIGMYLFLRRWRLPRDAALFGAMAFAFSGFSLLHFVHVNALAIVAHLPWLLLEIDVVDRCDSIGEHHRR